MNFTDDDKKKIKIAIIMIVISVLLTVVSLFFSGKGSSTANRKAKELGTQYYQDELYPAISQTKEFLDMYNKEGFKVNLVTLLDDNDDYVTYFNGDKDKCDYASSYVLIYPEKPYSIDNFKIETKLECE